MTDQSQLPEPAVRSSLTNHSAAGSVPTNQSHPVLPSAAKHSQYVSCVTFLLFYVI